MAWCWSPRHVPLAAYVNAAGRRWTTEENFQAGKGLAGLDEHQVRTWTAWHRWVTLAMLALAFLAAALIRQPAGGTRLMLRWSAWRRRHQHTARACHYQRQAAHDP